MADRAMSTYVRVRSHAAVCGREVTHEDVWTLRGHITFAHVWPHKRPHSSLEVTQRPRESEGTSARPSPAWLRGARRMQPNPEAVATAARAAEGHRIDLDFDELFALRELPTQLHRSSPHTERARERSAHERSARVRGARMRGARMSGARMRGARMSGAR
eukprot:5230257-Prymnesium_polylepis.1